VACAEDLRVQAYFDGELDEAAAADVQRHLAGCADCRALLEDLGRLRTVIRRDLKPVATPELRARITGALDAQAPAPVTVLKPRAPRNRSFWLGALSGAGGSALAAGMLFVLLSPILGSALQQELVDAHVHSLLPSQLIQVESSDHHTVKPWFAGHADVSPVVADFAAAGYRLVGGRTDTVDHQRAAVLVYQHGAHVINVFSWEARRSGVARDSSRNGYHMIFWTDADLQYCAVSDTGWNELTTLVRLIREQGVREAHP
jgi:anti-sigma factor RsiW